MRQKRVKSYRKVMQLYQSTFKFREPYQLLVDSEFITSVVSQKLEFQDRLQDVLQVITQCCIQALYDLGPSGQPAVNLAKDFERRKCNHLKARPEEECLTAMAGKDNPHRYVIATQSLSLRKTLRAVPGLPIIYINRSVVLLETPSDQTMKRKEQMENAKLHVSTTELASLSAQGSIPTASNSSTLIDSFQTAGPSTSTSSAADNTEPGVEGIEQKKKRKRKGPSGPNPLSVKKKKSAPNAAGKGKDKGKKSQEDQVGSEIRHAQKRKREEDENVRIGSLAKRGAKRGLAAVQITEEATKGGSAVIDAGGEGMDKKSRKRKRKSNAKTGGDASTTASSGADDTQ